MKKHMNYEESLHEMNEKLAQARKSLAGIGGKNQA